MAAHDCHETDFLGAHRDTWPQQEDSAFELAYFDLSRKRIFSRSQCSLNTSEQVFFLSRCTAVHQACLHSEQRDESMRLTQYYYDGPLADSCSFTKPHMPMRGVNRHEEIHSLASAGFGKQFWLHSAPSVLVFEGHVPLGLAVSLPHVPLSLSHSHVSSVPLFSLSGHPGSASTLHDAWSSGKLSRSLLSLTFRVLFRFCPSGRLQPVALLVTLSPRGDGG